MRLLKDSYYSWAWKAFFKQFYLNLRYWLIESLEPLSQPQTLKP